MEYRREIDGLRTLAVLPVILFHAGFKAFSGGFVGVDVFFVISGYLITTSLLKEFEQGTFSIIDFYERRVRRILPALFVVMFVSLILGFFWLMPDEFKNFGQSIVATSLFSNNILLGLTSGYWDLASEFKPLLHTWSLGVEEHYYVIIPILLLASIKIGRSGVAFLLWGIFLSSFLYANWLVKISPTWAFYILPTRAWEISIGALTAFYLKKYPFIFKENRFSNILSFAGLMLILFSIFAFDKYIISPSWPILVPTIGAALILVFCNNNTVAFRILGNKIFVFFGLLSYSLYLWHQPVFAFLRIYFPDQLSSWEYLYLLPLIFLLSFLTWKYVETPFRSKLIGRKFVFLFSLCLSLFFIATGVFINNSYGVPSRVFASDISINDMDKRTYNERVFSYKKDKFSDRSLVNILIIGDSFARDFVNITLENFDISRAEIIYRNDLKQCVMPPFIEYNYKLYDAADVIVFASGNYESACVKNDIAYAENRGKKIFYIGTKHFGYNLNWLIHLDKSDRVNKYNNIPLNVVLSERDMASIIPRKNFISLLTPTSFEGKVPITDEFGRMLSTDRAHLTKYGAIFFGRKAVVGTTYADLFRVSESKLNY